MYRTITTLAKAHRCRHFYSDGAGLIALFYGGVFHWFRLTDKGYVETGTTATSEGADRKDSWA